MRVSLLSLLVAGLLAGGTTAWGADPAERNVDVQAGPVQVRVEGDREARQRGLDQRPETATKDLSMRMTQIRAMTIQNTTGDELGDVFDIVVDMKTGQIRYIAVGTGGFLGIGQKLLAVPYEALTLHTNVDGEYYFVLPVDNERLKEAPGFERDNWPDHGSDIWLQSDEFYHPPADDQQTGRRVPRQE